MQENDLPFAEFLGSFHLTAFPTHFLFPIRSSKQILAPFLETKTFLTWSRVTFFFAISDILGRYLSTSFKTFTSHGNFWSAYMSPITQKLINSKNNKLGLLNIVETIKLNMMNNSFRIRWLSLSEQKIYHSTLLNTFFVDKNDVIFFHYWISYCFLKIARNCLAIEYRDSVSKDIYSYTIETRNKQRYCIKYKFTFAKWLQHLRQRPSSKEINATQAKKKKDNSIILFFSLVLFVFCLH